MFCFVLLIWLHFPIPTPQNALFPVFCGLIYRKMLPGNCSGFLPAIVQVIEAKHVYVGNLIEKKNLFIFPCLIHKIKEVFSQKCSKVSVSKRGTNAFIPRILGKKKNLFSMALSIICCVGGQESKKQCIQSWSGRRLGVLSKTK